MLRLRMRTTGGALQVRDGLAAVTCRLIGHAPVEIEHRGIGIEHEGRGRGGDGLRVVCRLVVRDHEPAQLLHQRGLCAPLR